MNHQVRKLQTPGLPIHPCPAEENGEPLGLQVKYIVYHFKKKQEEKLNILSKAVLSLWDFQNDDKPQ